MDARAARWQALWAALERSAPAGLLERLLHAWREPQRQHLNPSARRKLTMALASPPSLIANNY